MSARRGHGEKVTSVTPPPPLHLLPAQGRLVQSDNVGQVFHRESFRAPIMSPREAQSLLSASTLSERSEDGDYGRDCATGRGVYLRREVKVITASVP